MINTSRTLLFLIFIFLPEVIAAQTSIKASISPFKDNAMGAYTLIHDDFGGQWAHGIEDYADTIAYRRGITFCFALIAGQCDETDWKNAQRLISHGHQVVNHSMNHKCGIESDWCTAGNWDEKDFHLEIDSSETLIQKYTGKSSAFFMFPFDLYTDTMITYLEHQGYAGARAGNRNALESAKPADPFYLNFKAFLPGYTRANLDSFAMSAVEHGGWAIREVHGVEDPSWGMISLKDYEAHLDFISKMQKHHQLWVATLSDVLLYKELSERYSINLETDVASNLYKVSFTENKKEFKKRSKAYEVLRSTASNKKLTVLIVGNNQTIAQIKQQENYIPFRLEKDRIIFDADPEGGDVLVIYQKESRKKSKSKTSN